MKATSNVSSHVVYTKYYGIMTANSDSMSAQLTHTQRGSSKVIILLIHDTQSIFFYLLILY